MRALARWGITPLLAAPVGAWALGLGDIEPQSALNQPFRAQIALVSASADELQGLSVALASPETFTRYGLDRPGFLSALEFRVVTDRNGRGIVQVSSRESIAEPFVTLLVEATWPRGRLLREYTVLLDPPVLLPAPTAPPAVQPAQTRTPAPTAPAGAINRPAPQPAPQREPAPRAEPAPGPVSNNSAPVSRTPAVAPGGVYGPVQRAETLWSIANRLRPEGVTVNQMMIAVYRANPGAFGGNINLLRAGATLRLPESADFGTLAATVANAEVRRQEDEWADRQTPGGQLRLLPPAEPEVAAVPAPAPARPAPAPAPAANAGGAAAAGAATSADAAESRRLLELRDQELRNLQQQSQAANEVPEETEVPPAAEPGVDLERQEGQIFADETPEEPAAEETPAPSPTPAPAPAPVASGPSLMSQVLDWVLSPVLWIGLGVAALLLTAAWFVRRRRAEPEDVTGRWEALQSEVDDEEVREATQRMRRQVPEDDAFVVEEQKPERPSAPAAAEPAPAAPRKPAAAKPARAERAAPAAPVATDETLSSQTVINLDQADAVAEADFHMAYGLYDQAAELVQKALDEQPDRRDLKLKLLEVFFVWGNKDAFLKAAQGLRAEIGDGADPDWDKVIIMGRQICPDETLFTEATTGPGSVDVDLHAGDSPLDLAFEDASSSDGESMDMGDLGAALDFNLESSDERPAPRPAAKPAAARDLDRGEDSLDIGERTAAGLEAALFAPEADDDDDTGRRTTPDVPADSLAITQESPTVERPQAGSDWATADSGTVKLAADSPTVETPTMEMATDSPTMETPTVETRRGGESPTVEQLAVTSNTGEYTAEIDLDDLGLDVEDLEELPSDLGDLPMAADRETDTREQPALGEKDDLLSATGVTQVLRGSDDEESEEEFEQRDTSVLGDADATMLSPGFDDGTMTGTEVLDARFAVDTETGDTSLVQQLSGDGLDLDLADLTQALHGADTVEQPRASSFANDVFGGGDTPLDLDIGADTRAEDDPTGTEEFSPLDPQTMTEVGTKLDLARAYIDMGDPEGARSILEEVLDEGDPNQRREAQGLIDVLSA